LLSDTAQRIEPIGQGGVRRIFAEEIWWKGGGFFAERFAARWVGLADFLLAASGILCGDSKDLIHASQRTDNLSGLTPRLSGLDSAAMRQTDELSARRVLAVFAEWRATRSSVSPNAR
jgi:hypothetical protein